MTIEKNRRRLIHGGWAAAGLCALATVIIMLSPGQIFSQFTLAAIEKAIEMEHRILHLPADELHERLAVNDSSLLLFDVRQGEEFETSHIQSAIRIDPDLSAEEFYALYGDTLSGKELIFYCSVGKRSSIMAERLADVAGKRDATVANLRGGLFRWYNSGLSVVDTSGATDAIHPFDSHWGQLVQKRAE